MIVFRATCEFDGLIVVRHLDVGQLAAADDLLLLFDGQRVPRRDVVHVLLNDDVAAAGELLVLGADDGRFSSGRSRRVLSPIDKADQVTLVEVPEPVHLVADRDRSGQPVHDLRGVLKAQVHPVRPDMEEKVARRGYRAVPAAGQRTERMQLGGPRPREQPVPGKRADPCDAGELAFRDPEPDRPLQPRQVTEEVANSGLAAMVHGHDNEDGRCCQRRQHGLRRLVARRHGIRHRLASSPPSDVPPTTLQASFP